MLMPPNSGIPIRIKRNAGFQRESQNRFSTAKMKPFTVVLITLSLFGASQAGTLSEGLLSTFAAGEKKDVVVQFNSVLSQVLANPSLSGLSGDERHNEIVNLLQQSTKAMQAPIINSLSSFGIKEDQVESFW